MFSENNTPATVQNDPTLLYATTGLNTNEEVQQNTNYSFIIACLGALAAAAVIAAGFIAAAAPPIAPQAMLATAIVITPTPILAILIPVAIGIACLSLLLWYCAEEANNTFAPTYPQRYPYYNPINTPYYSGLPFFNASTTTAHPVSNTTYHDSANAPNTTYHGNTTPTNYSNTTCHS